MSCTINGFFFSFHTLYVPGAATIMTAGLHLCLSAIKLHSQVACSSCLPELPSCFMYKCNNSSTYNNLHQTSSHSSVANLQAGTNLPQIENFTGRELPVTFSLQYTGQVFSKLSELCPCLTVLAILSVSS